MSRSTKARGGEVAKDFAEQGARFCVKQGMEAREDKVNEVIYQLSRSENWKTQDSPMNG
jgi:hypothetical protein